MANLKPLMTRKSYDELTPDHILDRAIRTMGGIDLDPCAEPILVQRVGPGEERTGASFNVPAKVHYTRQEDGLAQDWSVDGKPSRVYMNPPYGRDIKLWIEKLLEEVKAGHVEQAVCLLPARTDTRWMRLLAPYARCYISGRLKFKGHDNSAPFPSVVVYVADSGHQSFLKAYGDLGDCYWLIA